MFKGKQDPQAFKETMGRGPTSNLLQFVQLNTHQSKLTKDRTSPVQAGEFTVGPAATRLGEAFMAVIGPWRPHARYMIGGKLEAESFDAKAEAFERIVQKELELHASGKPGHIARTGIDVLMWIPKAKVFGSYFISGTAKAEAVSLPELQGKLVMVGCREVHTNVSDWHVPTFTEVTEIPADLPLPSEEDHARAMKAFANPLARTGSDNAPDPARPR